VRVIVCVMRKEPELCTCCLVQVQQGLVKTRGSDGDSGRAVPVEKDNCNEVTNQLVSGRPFFANSD
jgi:hypothetical protein